MSEFIRDDMPSLEEQVQIGGDHRAEDTYAHDGISGHVRAVLRNADSGDVVESRTLDNVVTKDFSILVARMCKDIFEPDHGIFGLAVGTGKNSWNPMSPPTGDETQRSLHSEIERKRFDKVEFIDNGGAVSNVPTDTVDFTTSFAEPEANGPLVEMGLIGGDVANNLQPDPITPASGPYSENVDTRGRDILCNYLTFPVVNKQATTEFTVTWRIQF